MRKIELKGGILLDLTDPAGRKMDLDRLGFLRAGIRMVDLQRLQPTGRQLGSPLAFAEDRGFHQP